MKTLVQGGTIVAFDGREHSILDDRVVVFDGNEISFVGERYAGPVERRIDSTFIRAVSVYA